MAEVHDRIGEARKSVPGDPIPHVAKGIAGESALLCFDELHVTDIADAMILGRLFQRPVRGAGGGGGDLQRAAGRALQERPQPRAVPALHRADRRSTWRSRSCWRRRTSGSTSSPASRSTSRRPMRAPGPRWTGCGASSPATIPGAPADLEVKGRKLRVPLASMGVARFAFAELCEAPLGANDFLHIAHAFHTVMIDGIPRARQGAARRDAPLRQPDRHALRQPRVPRRLGRRRAAGPLCRRRHAATCSSAPPRA